MVNQNRLRSKGELARPRQLLAYPPRGIFVNAKKFVLSLCRVSFGPAMEGYQQHATITAKSEWFAILAPVAPYPCSGNHIHGEKQETRSVAAIREPGKP